MHMAALTSDIKITHTANSYIFMRTPVANIFKIPCTP